MYFLTVFSGGSVVAERVPYEDYSEAIAACGAYYEPRSPGAVLQFSSVVVGKKFLRSYASLTRVEDLPKDVERSDPRRWRAAKDGNAFLFDNSYHFLVESEAGVEHENQTRVEDDEEDDGAGQSASPLPPVA
jgi:hypothetical protein